MNGRYKQKQKIVTNYNQVGQTKTHKQINKLMIGGHCDAKAMKCQQ